MRISKKRRKMIIDAISQAFEETILEHFNKRDMDDRPENWADDIRERFDALSEMQHRSQQLVNETLDK